MTVLFIFLILIILGLVCLSIPALSVIGVVVLLIGLLSPLLVFIKLLSTMFAPKEKEERKED